MAVTIQLRRDTSANWIASDAVLAPGEPAYETDTGKVKIGNGEARWGDLKYLDTGDDDALFQAIEAHILSLQSQNIDDAVLHAAVLDQIKQLQSSVLDDDGPSLFLLYENAKV